jgi:hypothetical protein
MFKDILSKFVSSHKEQEPPAKSAETHNSTGGILKNSHLADRLAAKNYRSATSNYLSRNAAKNDNFENFQDMLNPTRGVYLSKRFPAESAELNHAALPNESAHHQTAIDIPILTPEDVIFQILDQLENVEFVHLSSNDSFISKQHSHALRLRWVTKLASDDTTSSSVLRRLCAEGDCLIRQVIAENPNTPIDVIWKLTKDSDVDIRYVLAENHNIGIEALGSLAEDENPYVASRAQTTLKRMQGGQLVNNNRFTSKSRKAAFS